MDSVRGRFPQRGGFVRILDEPGLTDLGRRLHRNCDNGLAPLSHEMRTRGTPFGVAVQSSCSIVNEPATRASGDRPPEVVERSPASDRQPQQWVISYPSRLQRLGDAR